ncbi:hypothetical protein TNCT_174631 [Trichonephila clavata]|uniref:Uncharacterized protein n=1 Tax=Trichonephila clavata TaxID=2740835 RepID=A0A8X6H4P7_TRICU|nr:hypothetical protein TNCT_174631 [Trichonephila clavata]
MSFTTNGLEVTKVCLVGANGVPIYNTFVKPDHKILDYNTFYNRVTAADPRDVPVSLSDVQAYLMKLFNKDYNNWPLSELRFYCPGTDSLQKKVDTSVIY